MKLGRGTVKHCPSKVSLPLGRVLQCIRPWREVETEPSTLDPASAFFWIQKSFTITDSPKVIDKQLQFSQFYHMANSIWCFLNSTRSWEHDARKKKSSFTFKKGFQLLSNIRKQQEFSCLVNLKSTNSSLSKPSFINLQLENSNTYDFFSSVCILYR